MRNLINKYRRHISAFFLLNIVVEIVSPAVGLALTSGPTQPEVQEFQAINASDMVDPSTGDFSYNIPLIEVDGYPLNLSYRAGASMDQEATFVGLGWNLNAGSISRGLRGLPDDFNGDEVTKKMNIKESESYGITIGAGGEVFGLDVIKANISYGITYNTYSGYDFVKKLGISLNVGCVGMGFGIASSGDGLTLSPNLSLSAQSSDKEGNCIQGSATLGTSFNSRTGMKELSLNVNASPSINNKQEKNTQAFKKGNKASEDPEKGNKHSSGMPLGSVGGGSSIGFCSPTFVPQINMPMKTLGASGSFKIGGTVWGVDLTADISGNYSRQGLKEKSVTSRAYGYLNLQNGQDLDDVLMDFNREKDGSFTEATPNLPIPNLTYDNFSVMGQGVGGSYRAYRSDIGYVFDARANTEGDNYHLGGEVSVGNTVQLGTDFVTTLTDGTSGKWTSDNSVTSFLKFEGTGSPGYEPAYFKEMGEMSVDEDMLYDVIQREKAVRFKLDDAGELTPLSKTLITENSEEFSLSSYHKRTKRVKRNQLFSYLTVKECETLALQTSLFSEMAKFSGSTLTNGHHIGQITTTKTDGTRYVYGLPVYNNYQKEASFNVSGNNVISNSMVSYSGSDDTENNAKGEDNFYTGTETPAYAYAYMLTAVLSSDYVDKTGNGPTPDDVGNYTLFRYDPAVKVQNYQWRSPHSFNGTGGVAGLDEGLITANNDNKGSYTYGKKDIYYLTSVEGKNSIAKLEYWTRSDGNGVQSEDGGNNTGSFQRRLEYITLYAMADYNLKLSNPSHIPTIVKRAYFSYDYSLCPGTYNSSSGKLTLKQVHFSFGKSNKGILSPYKFKYNNTVNGVTVSFDPAAVDRWGNYKPSPAHRPNSKFPYVEQYKALEDQYVALWNLKSIQLPSGGMIDVDYESDDYGYIQNKRAGEMCKIVGFNSTNSVVGATNQLFTSPTSASNQRYLIFWLRTNAVPSSTPDFIADYLEGIDDIYFRCYTHVNCGANGDGPPLNFGKTGYEFLQGYAEIDKTGNWAGRSQDPSTGRWFGYVKLKLVPQSRSNQTLEHPISKTAWQFARMKTPKKAYSCVPGSTDPAGTASSPEDAFKAMADAGFIKNTIQSIKGYNGALKSAGYGDVIDTSLAWIRTNNPDYCKLGGGHRVKEVRIADKWDKMLSATAINATQGFQYGQRYEYLLDQNGRTISSGVASYEPTFGADENSFRKPIYIERLKYEALFMPDNNMYMEQPMGEAFFPSPSVVYSRVAIMSLASGAGATVNEYYTAKDFPTYVHSLPMQPKRKQPSPFFAPFSFSTYDRFTGSQGYSIELNDMHGKAKAIHQYEDGKNAPTISTVYKYKCNGDKLVNEVKTVAKNGSIKTSRIGVEYDFYVDFRENTTSTVRIDVQGNAHVFVVPPVPVVSAMVWPGGHSEEIQIRSAVTNKVIYKYGIIDRVETTINGQVNSTDNLLWDSETGQVLLTATKTDFKDSLYQMAYPGHWAYEGLAGGYKNTGIEIKNPSSIVSSGGSVTGKITDPTYLAMLYPGDEIAIITSTSVDKGYVDKIGNDYYFTKNQILPFVGLHVSNTMSYADLQNCTIKVLRSGRHNLQDQKVGAISCFKNPLTGNPSEWPPINENYMVLNATAVEMDNAWQGYCACDLLNGAPIANQYLYGIKGVERKIKDYTYLTVRKQTKQDGNSNIRRDGAFEKFAAFWTPNGGNDWVANPNNWSWVSETQLYSSHGFGLEEKDALERRSAAQYGYQQTLPVALVSNSYYKLSANENFEYNDLNYCGDDHLGFNNHRYKTYQAPGNTVKTQKYSHTGKRSVVVPANGTVTVSKQINQCN